MDFVVGLPKTLGKIDSIWVIVDTLTKSGHFFLVMVTYNAEKLAKLYISEIIRVHGVSLSIISDRGTQFTSKFFETRHPRRSVVPMMVRRGFRRPSQFFQK